MQRFKIAIPTEGSGVVLYPMKEWLRSNGDRLDAEIDPDALTSRQLRSQLVRRDWIVADTPTEVRLMPPEFRGTSAAAGLLSDAIDDVDATEPSNVEVAEDDVLGFRFERHLQQFVADNLHTVQLAGKRVRPFKGDDGRDGLEYVTPVGRIDLLAVDDQDGLVIFEFKRAKAPDAAIGQLTRYMGCITSTLANGRAVTGVIVAPAISYELRCSAMMVPNIHLFECEMSFALRPAALPAVA
jgi:hypothetical protein